MTDATNTNPDLLFSGDNRPACYFDPDGTLVIRASALGTSCLYELVAAAQGYTPAPLPEVLTRAFRKGHELEPVVLQAIADQGVYLRTQQQEGHLLVLVATQNGTDVVKVRFHSDAIGILPLRFMMAHDLDMSLPDGAVIEVKAIGDAGWQQARKTTIFDYISEYAWQFSVMMLGTGLPLLGAYYNKGLPEKDDNGIISSPLCPDKGSIHYEYFTEPPISYADIVAKVSRIYELATGEDVVQSGRGCDNPKQWPCRYSHIRPESGESEDVGYRELPPEQQEEFDNLVRRYVMYKGTEDEAKKMRQQALAEINEMIGKTKQTIVTDNWVVPMVRGSTNNVVWKKVPAELKEQVDLYREEGEYFYLRDIKSRSE